MLTEAEDLDILHDYKLVVVLVEYCILNYVPYILFVTSCKE